MRGKHGCITNFCRAEFCHISGQRRGEVIFTHTNLRCLSRSCCEQKDFRNLMQKELPKGTPCSSTCSRGLSLYQLLDLLLGSVELVKMVHLHPDLREKLSSYTTHGMFCGYIPWGDIRLHKRESIDIPSQRQPNPSIMNSTHIPSSKGQCLPSDRYCEKWKNESLYIPQTPPLISTPLTHVDRQAFSYFTLWGLQ